MYTMVTHSVYAKPTVEERLIGVHLGLKQCLAQLFVVSDGLIRYIFGFHYDSLIWIEFEANRAYHRH
jgi:hypothetical protein